MTLVAAHAAGHLLALEHPGRGGALADGAGLAVHLVGTVAGPLALEVVSLHGAGEALALADRWSHRPARPGPETVDADLLADLVAR